MNKKQRIFKGFSAVLMLAILPGCGGGGSGGGGFVPVDNTGIIHFKLVSADDRCGRRDTYRLVRL